MPVGSRKCVKNSGVPTCSCRECVLARWEAAPGACVATRRGAVRYNNSPLSSENASSMGSGSTPRSSDATPRSSGFRGFSILKAVDHVCASHFIPER